MKPIFEEGLEWNVWKAEAEHDFPDLPDIAQRALNAKYSVQQGQDQFQVFSRAALCWSTGMANGKNNPNLCIVKDIIKANPKCTGTDVEALVEIARRFGGSDGKMVEHFRLFIGTFKHPGRTVATVTLQAMATLRLAPDELCPMFFISIPMALAAAPHPNFITSSDIKSIVSVKFSKVASMIENETMIKSMLDIVADMGVPIGEQTKIVGEFRTSLVFKFFKKVKKLESVSIDGLACKCFEDLLVRARTKKDNPWMHAMGHLPAPGHELQGDQESRPKSAPGRPKAAPAAISKVVHYEDGKAAGVHCEIIASKGFMVDGLIKHKTTGACHIPSMHRHPHRHPHRVLE